MSGWVVQGLNGFRVLQNLRFRVQDGSWLRVQGSGFKVHGSGSWRGGAVNGIGPFEFGAAKKTKGNALEAHESRKNRMRTWQALWSPDCCRFPRALAGTPVAQNAWRCPKFKTCKTVLLPIEIWILIFRLFNPKSRKPRFCP